MRGTVALGWLAAHAAGAVALAAALLGCSGGSAAPSAMCPNEGNLTCPSASDGGAGPPSYKSDVQPIFASRCYGCHGPGGIEVASIDLTTYHDVVANTEDVVGQVGECMMPPPDAGQPTLAERQTLFEWIACGEPNN
jgi:hypothetical protein